MCSGRLYEEVREEVTTLLRDMIRIDTTNPPGNETQAAEYLVQNLEKEGFSCEIFESKPRRGSMITRIEGDGTKPSLLLLSHLDVVSANPREWSVDPFGGEIKDGFVWGRGALDMKSMTVVEVMVMKLLRRHRVKLKGDVTLCATADEEKGGQEGIGWLSRNHAEKIRADYVINEGGGLARPINAENMYTVQTAEKGMLWFKVKAKGTPGHGSIPGGADNAIVRMNRVIDKLGNHVEKITLTPTVREYLAEIASRDSRASRAVTELLENPAVADRILNALAKNDKFFAEELRAKLRMTMTPTMIQGGVKENIVPSLCEAVFDCRLLPGQRPTETMNTIRKLLEEVDLEKLEFETIETSEPSESPSHTPMYEQIAEVMKDFDTASFVVPDMLTGGTDSRFLRKMSAVAYGFHPMRADMDYGEIKKGIHGIDERISIDNLVFGTSVLYEVVERFMT